MLILCFQTLSYGILLAILQEAHFTDRKVKLTEWKAPQSNKTTKGFQPVLAGLQRLCICLLAAVSNHITAYSHQTLGELGAGPCTRCTHISVFAGCRVLSWEETQAENEDHQLLRGAKQCSCTRLVTPPPLAGLRRHPGSTMVSLGSMGKSSLLQLFRTEQEKAARSYIFHPPPPVLRCGGYIDWVGSGSLGTSLGMLMPGRGAR